MLRPCPLRPRRSGLAEQTAAYEATKRRAREHADNVVFEAIGEDKVRVTCQSWEDARVILPEQALLVVAQGKTLNVMRTDRPAELAAVPTSGLADAGYGPETK